MVGNGKKRKAAVTDAHTTLDRMTSTQLSNAGFREPTRRAYSQDGHRLAAGSPTAFPGMVHAPTLEHAIEWVNSNLSAQIPMHSPGDAINAIRRELNRREILLRLTDLRVGDAFTVPRRHGRFYAQREIKRSQRETGRETTIAWHFEIGYDFRDGEPFLVTARSAYSIAFKRSGNAPAKFRIVFEKNPSMMVESYVPPVRIGQVPARVADRAQAQQGSLDAQK